MSGTTSYHAGRVAEDRVCDAYLDKGYHLLARRWRGRSGEIDLVLESDGQVVFVEVKQSSTFAKAAANLSPRQMRRIYRSAGDCLRFFADGQNTKMRIDVALVDSAGQIDILPNAIMP